MNPTFSIQSSDVKPKAHFHFLDGLRAIAAFWVILYHVGPDDRLTQLTKLLPEWLVTIIFKSGSLGVSIFFVLSGFVIAYSMRNAKIDLKYFQGFTLRRFIRLSPPYYVAIIIALAFALLSSYAKGNAFAPMGEPVSLQRLFAHLFYVQSFFGFQHIDDVYWTLCLEVQFYLVFGVLLGLSQWLNYRFNFNYGLAIVFIPSAIVAVLFPMGILGDQGRPITFLPLWYGFLLGVFAYWSWQNKWKRNLFYLYSVILVAVGVINSSIFAIACVLTAVMILEVARANCLHTWFSWSWLQFLGNISYTLYLTHVPLLGAVFFVFQKFFGHSLVSELLSLVVAISVCIACAVLMWQFVEKPSIKWSRSIKLVNSTEAIKA
ncbi:acyltransferase family protein [Nostoc sp. UHCC 0870]|uniref:acyltransferase family protein n=1 Tax=Nostoc sp. UHCC 0870 TaxID=2914041 RepID=UPI001EDE8F00|nr:acyltransferase [Nostoc sp. UHCC 0870]UKO99574.1 acyltransferase [Nostoc sp. UHCC 0870]